MPMSRQIKIEILGDASDAQRAMRSVSDAGGKMGGLLHGVATAAGTAVGGGLLFAAKGITSFVGDGLKSLENLDKIAAQTAAVVKSTGGAAHVSAKDVANYGDKIERLTGIESEQVQEGQNLLLTFTEIQNRTGKGNDVFNQATKTLTDMSVALGGDVKGSAVQLGKALNDPIAGISALSRVGVTFTEQQKDQIKAMVEAGNVAGAQKVILAELNKEFGGSADAFGESRAGKIAKFKNALGAVGETIAAAVLPFAVKLGEVVAGRVLPAIQNFADRVGPSIERIGSLVRSFFYTLRSGFSEDDVATGPERLAFFFRDHVLPVIERVANFMQDNLRPVLITLGVVIATLVVPPLIAAAFAAVTAAAPFLALAAVVAGVILVWQRFPIVREIVGAVADFVGEKFAAIKAWADVVFPQVLEAVSHVFNAIGAVIGVVVSVAAAAWRLFGDDILKVATGVFREVGAVIEFAVNTIAGVIRFVLAIINGDWGQAWAAIKDIFGGALHFIVETLRNAGTIISGVAGGMFDGIRNAFRAAINWIIDRWNGLEFRVPEVKVGPATFGGFTLGMPDIPKLARGGITTGPSFIAGDNASGVEAIVPLERAAEFGFGGNNRPQTIILEIDGRAVARAIAPPVRDELLRIGGRNNGTGL